MALCPKNSIQTYWHGNYRFRSEFSLVRKLEYRFWIVCLYSYLISKEIPDSKMTTEMVSAWDIRRERWAPPFILALCKGLSFQKLYFFQVYSYHLLSLESGGSSFQTSGHLFIFSNFRWLIFSNHYNIRSGQTRWHTYLQVHLSVWGYFESNPNPNRQACLIPRSNMISSDSLIVFFSTRYNECVGDSPMKRKSTEVVLKL